MYVCMYVHVFASRVLYILVMCIILNDIIIIRTYTNANTIYLEYI